MKITLYGTKICPACNKAKDFFKQHSLVYDYKEVGNDISVEDYVDKTGMTSVPYIEIDDKSVHGFNAITLSRILKLN